MLLDTYFHLLWYYFMVVIWMVQGLSGDVYFFVYFILLWPLSRWQQVELSSIFHYHHCSHELHDVVIMATLLLMTIEKLTFYKSHNK
jgi:hypothetical protein